MTRDDLADAMLKAYYKKYGEVGTQRESMLAILDAIGKAGFRVIGPEVTEDMADAGWEKMRELEKRVGSMPSGACLEIWKAMLNASWDMGKNERHQA